MIVLDGYLRRKRGSQDVIIWMIRRIPLELFMLGFSVGLYSSRILAEMRLAKARVQILNKRAMYSRLG